LRRVIDFRIGAALAKHFFTNSSCIDAATINWTIPVFLYGEIKANGGIANCGLDNKIVKKVIL
jgi:hypothetical protein